MRFRRKKKKRPSGPDESWYDLSATNLLLAQTPSILISDKYSEYYARLPRGETRNGGVWCEASVENLARELPVRGLDVLVTRGARHAQRRVVVSRCPDQQAPSAPPPRSPSAAPRRSARERLAAAAPSGRGKVNPTRSERGGGWGAGGVGQRGVGWRERERRERHEPMTMSGRQF
jgi:hypothetical protein